MYICICIYVYMHMYIYIYVYMLYIGCTYAVYMLYICCIYAVCIYIHMCPYTWIHIHTLYDTTWDCVYIMGFNIFQVFTKYGLNIKSMSFGSKRPKRVVFEVQREEELRRQERLRQDLYEIYLVLVCHCFRKPQR